MQILPELTYLRTPSTANRAMGKSRGKQHIITSKSLVIAAIFFHPGNKLRDKAGCMAQMAVKKVVSQAAIFDLDYKYIRHLLTVFESLFGLKAFNDFVAQFYAGFFNHEIGQ